MGNQLGLAANQEQKSDIQPDESSASFDNSESIKFLDWVQKDRKEFNDEQTKKKEEFALKYGEDKLAQIMYGNRHHPLRTIKTIDSKLTEMELNQLKKFGIYFRPDGCAFGESYLRLYNNDMPVMVTADSMLFALHKFYDNFLKNLEETELIKKLNVICKELLDNLYSIEPTEKNKEILKNLELFLWVPYVLLNLNSELTPSSGRISCDYQILFSKEELNYVNDLKVQDINKEKELSEGYSEINKTKLIGDYGQEYNNFRKKLKSFREFYGFKLNIDFIETLVLKSPKLCSAFEKFKIPDISFDIVLRYNEHQAFDDILKSISNHEDIALCFGDLVMNINGNSFKPRGHYTKSLRLENYFRAFSWLSKFVICFDKNSTNLTEYESAVTLACILSTLGTSKSELFSDFEKFISKIIGEPDGYTISNFKWIVDKLIPLDTISNMVSWILDHPKDLSDLCRNELVSKSKLQKYLKETDIATFSLIGKGTQIDNLVLQHMVDKEFRQDDGTVPMRKFPFIFDLVYTLFDNKEIYSFLQEKMDKIELKNRDGYNYRNHLDSISKECEKHEFDHTLYSQELKMLRAFSQDYKLMKDKEFHPFNTRAWMYKQAQTQIGHYAELRHDNVLYLDEAGGFSVCCDHPDILIEPVPHFWREYLILVRMYSKKLTKMKKT